MYKDALRELLEETGYLLERKCIRLSICQLFSMGQHIFVETESMPINAVGQITDSGRVGTIK